MIPRNRLRPLLALTYLTAIPAGLASLAGIVRPQLYLPFTSEMMLPGAVGQDIVSLFSALGLLACAWAIRNDSWRAWLIWCSLNGYLFYAYALYAFDAIYNPLYLVYIALCGLTVYSVLFFFVWLDTGVSDRIDADSIPRRAVAAFLLLLVGMFAAVWLSLIIPGIVSKTPPDGATIFVLDLAFFLPLLVIVASMVYRHRPAGALLAPIVLIKVGTLGCSVLLGTLLAPVFGHPLDWASAAIYTLMGVGSAALGLVVLARTNISRLNVSNAA